MTLRRRLTIAFVACALLAGACFSLLGMMFVYTVEDRFFDRMLAQEAQGMVTPLRPHLRFYTERAQFPSDLARQMQGDVRQGEYFGDAGRHYHVRRVGQRYMVAEVSSQLVVRPRVPAIAGMLAGMAALLALVIGAGGYLFARRATAPLDKLARMLDSSGSGSIPRGFSASAGDDEVGALARALDDAMARLAEFVARERDFTRDASHELRTPVAIIDGAAALLESEALSTAGRAQLQRLRDACALMQRTIDTLLALAREKGANAPVRLLPLIESTIVRHAHLLDGKAVEVRVDVPSDATLPGEPGGMEILLANLIGNAFSHAHDGNIRLHFNQDGLWIENGGAVPEELGARLFEPGIKGDTSSGHGLGLAIAQRLAVNQGLRLSLTSSGGTVVAGLAVAV